MRCEIDFKEVANLKRPLKMIDSSTAISVPSLWLKAGDKGAAGNQPWKDSLEMISWQGFEQEDDLIGFCGNETTIFLNNEVASSRVDDSQTGFKGRRNLSKWQFGSKFLLKNVISTKSHNKRIQWWLRDYE
jgi:hypothetical protein